MALDNTDKNSDRFRVAIVGAGVTGLVCANELVDKHGWKESEIVILEARNRVGGRVWTTKAGTNTDIPYDNGAAWVHGTEGNPMLDLLADDQIIPVAQGNPWMRPVLVNRCGKLATYMDGNRVPREVVDRALDYHARLMRGVSSFGNELFGKGEGMMTTQLSLLAGLKNVEDSLSGQLSPYVEQLAPLFLHFIECWNGAKIEELQLCEFIDDDDLDTNDEHDDIDREEQYSPEGDWPGSHCIVRDGMEEILRPLLQKNIAVRLQHEVIQISQPHGNSTPIHIACNKGASIIADTCVVTIPAGCLPKVVDDVFRTTKLSVNKLDAISRMEAGSYKKVYLSFEKITWETSPLFLGLVWNNSTSPLGKYMIIDNLWAHKGLASLEAILIGSSAEWAYQKSTATIQEQVVAFMEQAMGHSFGTVMSCHVTRWEEDPFSRGAYSHTPLGGLERHKEELRRPEWDNSLFIAGEATISEYEGSIHAAILSGKETARSIQLTNSLLQL